MNHESTPTKQSIGRIAIIATSIIVGLWLLTYFVQVKGVSDQSPLSDKYGVLNSLFSGLALTGIILTILLQRNELSLQRQELVNTREELKRTATAQENSEIALKRQAENLKASAKLTALNTLVQHYTNEQALLFRNGLYNEGAAADAKRKEYVKKIEDILSTKDMS